MSIFDIFKGKKKKRDLLAELGEPPEAPDDLSELNLPPFPGENLPPPKMRPLEKFPDLPTMALPEIPEMPKFVKLEKVKKPVMSLFKPEPSIPMQRAQVNEPLFVSSTNFRLLLGDIMHLKNIFKDSTDYANRFEDFEQGKEKAMDQLRKHVEGIQQKLIIADKSLFK